MGCDYYIEKNLYIYYTNEVLPFSLNLERDIGYYFEINDDKVLDILDNDDYIVKWKKLKKYHLEPRLNPVIIYSNNSFHDSYLAKKYKSMIEYEINYSYKKWNDIKEMIIVEERYEKN